MRPSPGSPSEGWRAPHSHLLLATLTAFSGLLGQAAHHRAEVNPSLGSAKEGFALPHSHLATFTASAGLSGQSAHHIGRESRPPTGRPSEGCRAPHAQRLLTTSTA
mmetsp:Transcript_22338/g.56166  ORF Transcript_22338/g.56166 Transcript_22338/m.56166 type:complete len:106 (+) Transcript_22338:573-890(+)